MKRVPYHGILVTPKKRLVLLVFGILLILVQPVFTVVRYTWNFDRNAYPPQADSIGIPIFGEILTWFFLAPIAIFLIVRVLKNYRGSTYLFAKQSFARRLLGVNIVFGLLIGLALLQLYDFFAYLNTPVLVDVALSTYLLLCIRAVVASTWKSPSKNKVA